MNTLVVLWSVLSLWIFPDFLFGGQQEATLLFAGDAMSHQAQTDAARRTGGSYTYQGYYDSIIPAIASADYAVVNLETPVSGSPYSGYPCFNAPDEFLKELVNAGFDLFLTANNHTLDRRVRGAGKTLALLDTLNVDHIGTYTSAESRNTRLPFIKDINGFKIGFLNYTYGTNGFTPSDGFVVDYISESVMREDVAALREAGAELIVAAVHWGTEYILHPDKSQQKTADFLRELGVEMIIGGHPHVVQPMIFENGQLTVYSLGNFVSNMKTTDTRGGALLKVGITRDPLGKAVVTSARATLVFVEPPSYYGGNYKVVPIESVSGSVNRTRAKAFIESTGEMLRKSNRNVPVVGMNEFSEKKIYNNVNIPVAPVVSCIE